MDNDHSLLGLPDLSLVLPCYDEEEVIERTVEDLFAAFGRLPKELEIVAVDNGSRDRTGAILIALAGRHPRLVTARVEVNRGYGNGCLAGLPLATAPWVGILCADGQVAAADVAKLYLLAESSKEPRICKVRRRFRRDGLRRKVVSVAYNLGMNVLFPGIGSIDINGNPKIVPRSFLDTTRLESRDWFLDAEILLQARRQRLPVLEIDVAGHVRGGGASNVRASTCLEFARNILRHRFGPAADSVRETRVLPPSEGAVRGR